MRPRRARRRRNTSGQGRVDSDELGIGEWSSGCRTIPHRAQRRRDIYGPSPFHQRRVMGQMYLARSLVEHGADARAEDEGGSTLLHQASQFDHVDVAGFLIDRGADATAQEEDGSAPLHRASQYGYMDFSQPHIDHGADGTAQDKER